MKSKKEDVMREVMKRYKNKFNQAKQINSEVEQALIRVSFVSVITLYLVFNNSHIEPIALCLFYLVCGLYMFFNILNHPQKNERRQWTAMVLDISATSLEQIISASMAGVFIGVYLWLIMGYGLRYGTKFFKGCYVMSLVGFSTSLYLNPYWNQHQHLAYGFIVTMLLVPPHTLRLLVRLEKATKDARLASDAKSNFLSNISHEMRTPLNGIIGAAELLNKTELDKKQAEFMSMLTTSSYTLRRLINDVLDISKIEKGKMELEEVAFYFPDLIQRLNQVCNIEKERKQLWLRFHVDHSVDKYYVGSLQHIEQVLLNLVSNAIKFTQNGGIDVSVYQKESYPNFSILCIKIQDTGIGIKPDVLPHIFESFTQADSSITRRYGGTGLGTTISRELVRLMSGDITVSSVENEGTTFEVTIPLQYANAQQIELSKQEDISNPSNIVPITNHYKYVKKIRVLIADDNIVNRMILNETLQTMGCAVKAVDNGDEVLDMLESHQFDLMILDFNMPNMNGLDAFRIYHSLPGSKRIKTVILTADATKATHDICIKAGISQVITKPVTSKQIQGLIDDIWQQAEFAAMQDDIKRPAMDVGPTLIPRPTSINQEEALLDLERMAHLLRLGGGKDFLRSLISQFTKTNDELIHQIGHYCLDLEFQLIHKLAHSLSGESANMGLIPLSKQSRLLLNLTMNDSQSLMQTYHNLMDIYQASRHQLTQYQSKL
jgi:two-component system sensor histidine kinase RpfC